MKSCYLVFADGVLQKCGIPSCEADICRLLACDCVEMYKFGNTTMYTDKYGRNERKPYNDIASSTSERIVVGTALFIKKGKL